MHPIANAVEQSVYTDMFQGPADIAVYSEERKTIWDHEPASMKAQSISIFHLTACGAAQFSSSFSRPHCVQATAAENDTIH